jgi:hypothetical protein
MLDTCATIEPGQIVAALPIFGVYTEFICLPQHALVPVPSGLDAAEAVSLVLNYITTHDMARSKAYRWGEEGIAGICDDEQLLCFALSLWNKKDPILQERYFGLTNTEGNHGEDVKELYYYPDNTPIRWLSVPYIVIKPIEHLSEKVTSVFSQSMLFALGLRVFCTNHSAKPCAQTKTS